MPFTTDLIVATGKLLQAEGVGKWDGPYTATVPQISVDQYGSNDLAIALGVYPLTDDHANTQVIGVQAWIRGRVKNRTDAKNAADNCYNALHGLKHVTLGGIDVTLIEWRSQANLGLDQNERERISQNYYFTVTRPSTHILS